MTPALLGVSLAPIPVLVNMLMDLLNPVLGVILILDFTFFFFMFCTLLVFVNASSCCLNIIFNLSIRRSVQCILFQLSSK